jgi:hypothetical protein
MGQRLDATNSGSATSARPFRRTFVLVEGVTAAGGLMGSVMLISGTRTPPVSVLQLSA